MSTSGETADLMVRESIQITESAVKLAGLGAKNLAALLLAIANDQQKTAGKIKLRNLLRTGEALSLVSIKHEDLEQFCREGDKYGVLYCPIVNQKDYAGTAEIMVRAKDAGMVNHILELMHYPLPEQQKEAEKGQQTEPGQDLQEDGKNVNSRVPSERGSRKQENGAKTLLWETELERAERLSVRARMEAIQNGDAPLPRRSVKNREAR